MIVVVMFLLYSPRDLSCNREDNETNTRGGIPIRHPVVVCHRL